LARSGARRLVIVGGDSSTGEYPYPFHGSFAPWGVPLGVTLGGDPVPGQPPVPLSLLIGLWLLRRAFRPAVPAGVPVSYSAYGVDTAATPADCARLGAGLADGTPWAMLVLGDGAACHGPKAPGYDDPRAPAFDAAVALALAGADPGTLLALDPGLAGELRVAGRAPWQVLAGAVRAAGGAWRGDLLYHQAPYGVGYFVAGWTPAGGAGAVAA
jgi:hypothetical protein